MGKYLLENIRAAYPDARCTLAVSSRVGMIRDLFAAYHWLEVIEVNKNPASLWRFFASGRRDIVITPYTGGVFGILPKLVARLFAKTLIGYTDASHLNRFLFTKLIQLVGRSRAPRLLESDALAAIGIPLSVERLTFTYLQQPHLLEKFGLQNGKYVVLHLFAGSDARGLSLNSKHALISSLMKVLPEDWKLALTGGDKERESLGKDLPPQVILVHTSLQELAHLIDHSACVVSLDTGAAHIAAHMGKPLVVLASHCAGTQWWSPDMYGEETRTLFSCLGICKGRHEHPGYARCLDAIDPETVASRVAVILMVK